MDNTMLRRSRYRKLAAAVLLGALSLVAATVAFADHSWNNYHWGHTATPFTLSLVDSVTSDWDSTLVAVSDDWSLSTVLDTTIVAGNDSTSVRKPCKAASGKIRACNAKYGFNGWIGLATIWISGDHIVQGTAKVNDSYFNTTTYNDPNAKRHVLCQEVGHTFGLDHQPSSATSCMSGGGLFDPAYVSPNQHDYDQLVTIYSSHVDATNTFSTSTTATGNGPATPGESQDAVPPGAGPNDGNVFVRDLGGGRFMVSYVIWVEPGAQSGR